MHARAGEREREREREGKEGGSAHVLAVGGEVGRGSSTWESHVSTMCPRSRKGAALCLRVCGDGIRIWRGVGGGHQESESGLPWSTVREKRPAGCEHWSNRLFPKSSGDFCRRDSWRLSKKTWHSREPTNCYRSKRWTRYRINTDAETDSVEDLSKKSNLRVPQFAQSGTLSCSVLQRVAVFCSVLQCDWIVISLSSACTNLCAQSGVIERTHRGGKTGSSGTGMFERGIHCIFTHHEDISL